MTKDEALKLALEVMQNQGDVSVDEWIATEKAIKEALAQPEPEYLAFMDTPQSKPLSDEEILTYRYMIDWTAEWSYINFARAIEAAHGIKGEA